MLRPAGGGQAAEEERGNSLLEICLDIFVIYVRIILYIASALHANPLHKNAL